MEILLGVAAWWLLGQTAMTITAALQGQFYTPKSIYLLAQETPEFEEHLEEVGVSGIKATIALLYMLVPFAWPYFLLRKGPKEN